MSQTPTDEAELLELLELAKVGEAKARKLYETATEIAEKYEQRKESKQSVAKNQGGKACDLLGNIICYGNQGR